MGQAYVSVEYSGTERVSVASVLGDINNETIMEYLAKQDGGSAALVRIKQFVSMATTEEVKEVYDYIVGSWHFDTVLFEAEREK